MSRRAFDRIMIDLEAGGNAKLGRLTDPEFRCHITGVLPLAAKSPIRGRLLVGEHKAEAGDIARQARMSVQVAQRTLTKLRHLGIVETDDELGCELVHDFEDWNPRPKIDRTNAERQARYRQRMQDRYAASRNGVTNGPVTPAKLEVEEKNVNTDASPAGDAAAADLSQAQERLQRERQVFDTWVEATGRTDQTVFDEKRRRVVRKALGLVKRDSWPDEVLDAARGVGKSEHHMSNRQWSELHVVLRDVGQIENFRDLHRGHRPEGRSQGALAAAFRGDQ